MAVANRYLQIRVQHLRMHHQPWVVLSAWGLLIHLHQQAQHPCSHPSPRVVQPVQAVEPVVVHTNDCLLTWVLKMVFIKPAFYNIF